MKDSERHVAMKQRQGQRVGAKTRTPDSPTDAASRSTALGAIVKAMWCTQSANLHTKRWHVDGLDRVDHLFGAAGPCVTQRPTICDLSPP